MWRQDLPISVQNLFKIGLNWEQAEWPDYSTMDIRPEHIPALISVLEHTKAIWDEYEELEDAPENWAPVHAWRALGQLHAVEALPALLDLLSHMDDYDADIIQEELPLVFSSIGPAAIPALTDYFGEPEHDMWALLDAAEGLTNIALQNPQSRTGIVETLTNALRNYNQQDLTYNGFMAMFLKDLKAVEAAPLVEEAFQADMIDEMLFGDWQDYQIGVGLLEARTAPRRTLQPLPHSFSDGLPAEERKIIELNRKADKKEKNKRKQAKAMRSKNRKKKKK